MKALIFSTTGVLLKISYFKEMVFIFEMVFVGLCEVFVCLEFSAFFFFSLAAKLIGPFPECEFFKNVDFFPVHPLNENLLLKGPR